MERDSIMAWLLCVCSKEQPLLGDETGPIGAPYGQSAGLPYHNKDSSLLQKWQHHLSTWQAT
jgi:hypothetical protein